MARKPLPHRSRRERGLARQPRPRSSSGASTRPARRRSSRSARFHGKSTRELLDWARARRRPGDRDRSRPPARRCASSPRERPELELVEATSIEALAELEADAMIIDGDHNYFTLSEELRLINERTPRRRAAAADLPRHRLAARPPRRLLRAGADPRRASPAARAQRRTWSPASRARSTAGCRSPASPPARAGPRNGILTAIEDFLAGRDELAFAQRARRSSESA